MSTSTLDNTPLNILHPGLRIANRYILNERIAIGGMGEVWKAQDENLNKPVAIKILRPELAGQKLFLSRLEYESKNARQVRHPNLAHIFNSGEQDGLGWIAMELVVGEPLTSILEKYPIVEPKFILSVLYQACGALAAVHKAGIIHRDIKPGNILVTKEGIVKLSDFGISKASDQVTLTAEGMVMGTAQYLSPEQAIGKPASAAGDLYALGVITYEALIGNRPFTGEKPVDIAFAHVNSPIPVLPSSVPEPLQRLIRNLLKKDPQERWNDAASLQKKIVEIWHELTNTPYHEWADTGITPVPPPTATFTCVNPNNINNSQTELPAKQNIVASKPSYQASHKADIPNQIYPSELPASIPPDPQSKKMRAAKRRQNTIGYAPYQSKQQTQSGTAPAADEPAPYSYYPDIKNADIEVKQDPVLKAPNFFNIVKAKLIQDKRLYYYPRHASASGNTWGKWAILFILLFLVEFFLFYHYGSFSNSTSTIDTIFYSVWVTNLQIE